MTDNTVTIRDAEFGDLQALTLLMNDLSYPTTLNEMEARFEKIAAHPDYKTILAIVNNEVVGMAGLMKGHYYEKNGDYLRILAFVVKQNTRNLGIGRTLIQAAESWAISEDLNSVAISSGNREDRIAAHAFYQKMGYAIRSSGFFKQL